MNEFEFIEKLKSEYFGSKTLWFIKELASFCDDNAKDQISSNTLNFFRESGDKKISFFDELDPDFYHEFEEKELSDLLKSILARPEKYGL